MSFSVDILKKLEDEYGMPLYVFDEKGFIENYRNLESCFQKIYKNYRIAYSYKTNYTPYIANVLVIRTNIDIAPNLVIIKRKLYLEWNINWQKNWDIPMIK